MISGIHHLHHQWCHRDGRNEAEVGAEQHGALRP